MKRLLARFLQRWPGDLQANVWPLLPSAVADLLNSKCHSTINDVPFRIYKNREPSCLVNYVIPDGTLWIEGIEDGLSLRLNFHWKTLPSSRKMDKALLWIDLNWQS